MKASPESSDPVVVQIAGGVATLWLNRPDRRNAVSYEMWGMLDAAYTSLAGDPSVRVLVVRGADGHFCAGADIEGLGQVDGAELARANRAADDALATFPKPTIAFVTGSCVGGGAGVAVACDLRIADTTARFGITPARLGLVYPPIALSRVVRLVGPSTAKRLLYTAELVDAATALAMRLVDEVHEPAAALERLAELTGLIAQRSLLTQVASKEMVDAIVADGHVPDEMARGWAQEMASSPDGAEGRAAFLEGRAPVFTWTTRRA
jgi:enoyl-CoA hydratase/carnithine racemase